MVGTVWHGWAHAVAISGATSGSCSPLMAWRSKTAAVVAWIAGGVLVLAGLVWAVNPVFWDRYLHAYPFQSFVDNPFPTSDRLYPQERVPGLEPPRAFVTAPEGKQSIAADALAAAAKFAEQSDSTSLIVLHNGVIQLERYWLGADRDRFVYSFSMHKSVVSLLIGMAIEDGSIGSPDDPLARYIDAWGPDDPRSSITIRQALQMNSGFEPMDFPRNPFSKHVRRQIGTDLAAAALAYRLQDPPGEVFNYNGVNPTLLVMLLEQATGRRYADYLSERLWKPLGNGDAAVWLDRENGLARGATSLFARPMDWARVGQMMLSRGKVGDLELVPAAWIELMTTPSATNPMYGLLVWLGTEYVEERTLEAFAGFAATMSESFKVGDIMFFDGLGGQRVYIVPSKNLVIVRTGLLNSQWEDVSLPNILIGGLN